MSMMTTPVKTALLAVIAKDYPNLQESQIPSVEEEQRALLDNLLIASDSKWDVNLLLKTDQVWEAEKVKEKTNGEWTNWKDIPAALHYHGTNLSIHKGDITKLEIDAIVNAANDQGTGCYQPNHRCIDNTIHRRAGPRLRQACRRAMKQRGYPLSAGTDPIVTPAYFLPSSKVIHVTGPHVKGDVERGDQKNLQSAYKTVLEAAAANGVKSLAFCGISTGLFGYPKREAAKVALKTVKKWLEENPNQLDGIVFDVYADEDEQIYNDVFGEVFDAEPSSKEQASNFDVWNVSLSTAKQWIQDADAVLVVAGAGMSIKEGESVYTSPRDFKKHYPFFNPKWGYRTAYEAMGLFGDRRVPENEKWAFWAKHFDNMRWKMEPAEGYKTLLEMVQHKDYFVLTSNVDGCFERSGFAKDKIYTPQGEWTYLQCMRPCRHDSVFEARPYLDKMIPQIQDGRVPQEALPRCPNCGSKMFGNVRGSDAFLHHSVYERANLKLQGWLEDLKESKKKVVVIEIGAGMNTPMVTRFISESVVRDLGSSKGRLIRVNPSDPEVPNDLKAIGIPKGWDVLEEIQQIDPSESAESTEALLTFQEESGMATDMGLTRRLVATFGHFSWKKFLDNLRDG